MYDKLQFVSCFLPIREQGRQGKAVFIDKLKLVVQFLPAITPAPLTPVFHQTCLDWVVEHIFHCGYQLPCSDHVVEAFMLPKLASARQHDVAFPRAAPFEPMHNLRQTGIFTEKYQMASFIELLTQRAFAQERRKDYMHVIRHHRVSAERICFTIKIVYLFCYYRHN